MGVMAQAGILSLGNVSGCRRSRRRIAIGNVLCIVVVTVGVPVYVGIVDIVKLLTCVGSRKKYMISIRLNFLGKSDT